MRHPLAAMCVGMATLCHLPTALAVVVTYDVTKQFSFLPGGNVVPTVNARTFQHAWVHDPGLRSDVKPLGQPAGFATDGFEVIVPANGKVAQPGLAMPLNEVVTAVPGAGAVVPRSTAKVDKPANAASASSEVTVNPFVAGGGVKGKLHVFGEADAAVAKDAYAFSSARVTAQGANKGRGGVVVRLETRTETAVGGVLATPAVGRWTFWDPIYFETSDIDTGNLLGAGTLLNIFGEGDGMLSWTNDSLSLDALNAVFDIDIDSPFTAEQGTLRLDVVGGVVTAAFASGIFSSLVLPSLGHASAFVMALSNDIALNYDLAPGQSRDMQVMFDFSGGGRAFAAVTEPGSLALVLIGLLACGVSKGRRPHPFNAPRARS